MRVACLQQLYQEVKNLAPVRSNLKAKGKQSDEVDGKATLNIRKLSITGLQSRKTSSSLVWRRTWGWSEETRKDRPWLWFNKVCQSSGSYEMGHNKTTSQCKAYKSQRNTSTNATTLDFLGQFN